MFEIDTRYGRLAVPDIDNDLIGRFLARYGEWGWDEARFVARALPPGPVRILDAGAFVGTFGLGVALEHEVAFVCFVEANPALIPLLKTNVTRHCQAPTAIVERVLAWPDARLSEQPPPAGNIGGKSFVPSPSTAAGPEDPRAPPCVTLAELHADHGPFDLLKLDVEGMEHGILKSDAERLSRGETVIWAECCDDPAALETAALLLEWGLELHYFAFPAHNPDNARGDPRPIFPYAYESGLLAAPHTPPFLDATLRRHGCILRPVNSLADLKDALWRTPRWGEMSWVGASTAELAALAGRQLRGETFETYLGPRWRPRPVQETGELRDRLDATTTALAQAQALVLEHQTRLTIERERAEAAEARMTSACAEALDRLAELGAQRERLAELESRVTVAERHAREIEASTTWRLSAPLRRALESHSLIHAILRRGLRLLSRVIRWRP